MKDWLKFFGFHIPYFMVAGAIGGVLWMYVIREYRISQEMMTLDQAKYAFDVVSWRPSKYKEMKRLMNHERLPINEKEKILSDERGRLKAERDRFSKDKKEWYAYKEEELSRLRSEKQKQDDLRAELDQQLENLKIESKMVKDLSSQVVSEKYKTYIATLVKMQSVNVARILADRPAKEIVQDLRQFKNTKAADVINELFTNAEIIEDETEKDDFINKLNEVVTLYRAEGLRGEK